MKDKRIFAAAVVVLVDRASKLFMREGVRVELGLFRFSRVMNRGMAFSLFNDRPELLTWATLLLVLVLAAWLIFRPDDHAPLTKLGLWLAVGGGAGNWIDRVRYGAVIDFIEPTFVRFAIFNIADIAVCVGIALAIFGVLFGETGKDGNHGKAL